MHSSSCSRGSTSGACPVLAAAGLQRASSRNPHRRRTLLVPEERAVVILYVELTWASHTRCCRGSFGRWSCCACRGRRSWATAKRSWQDDGVVAQHLGEGPRCVSSAAQQSAQQYQHLISARPYLFRATFGLPLASTSCGLSKVCSAALGSVSLSATAREQSQENNFCRIPPTGYRCAAVSVACSRSRSRHPASRSACAQRIWLGEDLL